MYTFFQYNWQVRDEWFEWCKSVDPDELTRERTGGMGSILKTLHHIVDVEQAWINGLQGKKEYHYRYEDYQSLNAIIELSDKCRNEIQEYLSRWEEEDESKTFEVFSYGEVVRHVIAHEIHHIGQLSIWSRELDKRPITANLIRRGLG
ncbi:DinB family protein [Evansella halocellulosilytica]|uniref:DinB family protein n=1 Tax=Evansella halocellulosilytica TaxID=2011013 RepID=UPI000BB75AD9|nr:DinB family protein [Evansella halocellulosilytica]